MNYINQLRDYFSLFNILYYYLLISCYDSYFAPALSIIYKVYDV